MLAKSYPKYLLTNGINKNLRRPEKYWSKNILFPSTMASNGANVGFPLPSRLESVGSL